ncbi:hypothetical protein [Streptomyces sp. NBC_01506]|uniref:hypothetical protein n=1 Tax=Streptomyces sp. NBC_01506 TaxID=2903887 RepID=UPI002F90816E
MTSSSAGAEPRIPASVLASPAYQANQEAAILREARSAGRRAGHWLRSLAGRPGWGNPEPHPVLALGDAVETALGLLNPSDTDTRDPHTGEITEGHGGVRAEVRERLWAPPAVFGSTLTSDQIVRVLAIVGATRIAADLHRYGDYTDDLPVLVAAIDHAVAGN